MAEVDKYTLEQHVKHTCLVNLKDPNSKFCGRCPFEEIIIEEFPDLKCMFVDKRKRKVNN